MLPADANRSCRALWSCPGRNTRRGELNTGDRRGNAMSGVVRTFMLAVAAIFASQAAAAQTLKAVKERGELVCGVGQGLAGFSSPDEKGSWSGFDVDFCRALAAAIFNDSGKVKYVPVSTVARFAPLQSQAIDVLSRNTTWSMSRDTELGLSFPVTTYYDGQGFMVPRSLKV